MAFRDGCNGVRRLHGPRRAFRARSRRGPQVCSRGHGLHRDNDPVTTPDGPNEVRQHRKAAGRSPARRHATASHWIVRPTFRRPTVAAAGIAPDVDTSLGRWGDFPPNDAARAQTTSLEPQPMPPESAPQATQLPCSPAAFHRNASDCALLKRRRLSICVFTPGTFVLAAA